jgi:hypothetical protein
MVRVLPSGVSFPESEMCAVLVIRVDNTTPIIVNREKSVTLKYSALAYPTKRSHKISDQEKKQFPVSGFQVGETWRLEAAREGSRRKNCASERTSTPFWLMD